MPTGACDHISESHNASTVNQTKLNNIHADATGTMSVLSAVQWTDNQRSQAQTNQQSGNTNSSMNATALNGNRSQAEETEHQVIPTIQALKNAADIHTKVNQRYTDLEEALSGGQQGNFETFLEQLQ